MNKRRDPKYINRRIVREAARKLRCSVEEIFIRAYQGARDFILNLNKIPEEVLAFARWVLKPKFPARPREKHRQPGYYRTVPCRGRY